MKDEYLGSLLILPQPSQLTLEATQTTDNL